MRFKRPLAIAVCLAVAPLAMAAGKVDEDRMVDLEQKVASLEDQLAEINARLEKLNGMLGPMMREQEAEDLLREINNLSMRGQQLEAQELMKTFMTDYNGTEAAKKASRLQRELAVVGKPAPAQFAVEKWYQGESEVDDLAGSRTSLLVFWEVWCPHCKREVPKMQATYEKYRDQGLQVIGLTKITKSATEESVAGFIEANKLSYPMAKEDGNLSRYFNVSGIPAAAVVKDGKIIWRGHPSRLTPQILESWL